MKERKKIGCLWGVTLFSIVISLTLIMALIFLVKHKQEEIKSLDVCTSKECTVAAASLLRSMDGTEDPCTDFYSYVCGQYMHKTSELSDHFVERKAIVELVEMQDSANDPEAVKKARMAYNICLNSTRIKHLGLDPLKTFLQFMGGWPISVGSWDPPPNTFIEDLLAKLEVVGYPSKIIALEIAPDPSNPDVRRITLDQPGNGDEDYDITRKRRDSKTEELETKSELIEITARLLGNNNNTDQIRADIESMLRLTRDLKKISSPAEDRKNQSRLYNNMTIKHLHDITNQTFNWLSFIRLTFGDDLQIDENEKINVIEVEYMRKLPIILAKYGRRTVTNFALWNVISNLLQHVTDKAYSQDAFRPTKRWQVCLQDTSEIFNFAMWRMFADNVLSNDTLEYAQELISNVQQSFVETITKNQWLDTNTKDNALKKLSSMIQMVGYPDWILDDEALNSYYEDFIVTPDHFTNMITASSLAVQRVIRMFRDPVDRKEWPEGISVLTANAFYVLASNTIFLPGGILQPPFYSPNRPESMNYGSIGAIIGHEMGHAFDDEGSQLDANGALNEWFTDTSRKVYSQKSECFKDQYNSYCFNDTKRISNNSFCVNGRLTLGENIPDNTGVQCAFNAYKSWMTSHPVELPMSGLQEFVPEQIFFLSYAYTWCENISPEQWQDYFGEDPHSPGRYRVQGPLANYDAFAVTFKCNLGPMNRGESNCQLW